MGLLMTLGSLAALTLNRTTSGNGAAVALLGLMIACSGAIGMKLTKTAEPIDAATRQAISETVRDLCAATEVDHLSPIAKPAGDLR